MSNNNIDNNIIVTDDDLNNKLTIIKLQIEFTRKFVIIMKQQPLHNLYIKYFDIRIKMIKTTTNRKLFSFLEYLQNHIKKIPNYNVSYVIDLNLVNYDDIETLDFFYDFIGFDANFNNM